jgi:SagB-type dehydrogenase family enzyme
MMDLRSGDSASTVRLWSFGEDTMLEDGSVPGAMTVVTRWGEHEITDTSPAVAESLRRMAYGPVSLHNTLRQHDAVHRADVERLERLLDDLGGAVVHSLGLPDGQGPLVTAVPTDPGAVLHPAPVPPSRTVRLSRFAVLRPGPAGMVLEVPDAPFAAHLCQPVAALVVGLLATPTTPERLAVAAGVPAGVARDLVAFLGAAGLLVVVDPDGPSPQDEGRATRGWAPHELEFHVRTRAGRGERPPDDAAAVAAPGPVTRPRPAGRVFPLRTPGQDLGTPLGRLLATDHTCPTVSGADFTTDQLGALLHHSARVRSTGPAHVPGLGDGDGHAASQRPYLSTACLYELELYLTVDRCTGLPRGVYHYDPLDHVLTLVEERAPVVDELLDIGRFGCGSPRRPAVVLTVTARMDRLTWVFTGASYAVALKHCGMFQSVLYLAAAALGMSAHAVPAAGGRTADALAGGPWPGEIGIGECVLDPVAAGA